MKAGFRESRRNKEEEERSPVHLYFTPLGFFSTVFHRKDATKGWALLWSSSEITTAKVYRMLNTGWVMF